MMGLYRISWTRTFGLKTSRNIGGPLYTCAVVPRSTKSTDSFFGEYKRSISEKSCTVTFATTWYKYLPYFSKQNLHARLVNQLISPPGKHRMREGGGLALSPRDITGSFQSCTHGMLPTHDSQGL